MIQSNSANLKEWQAIQRRGMVRYQDKLRARNLAKLKNGTLYPKKEHNFRVKKVPTNKNIAWYKKTLWRWFSQYIRLRDSDKKGICICITCERKHLWNGGQMQAGHFIPRNKGNAIYFDKKDVNAQCTYCNYFLSGNLAVYRVKIDEKWGKGTADMLEMKSRETKQFTIPELINMIQECKIEVKKLLAEKTL